MKKGIFFLFLLTCFIFTSVLIIKSASVWKSHVSEDLVPQRYFIYLSPFALFTIMLAGLNLRKSIQDPMSRLIINTLYAGTIIITSLNTFVYIVSLGLY